MSGSDKASVIVLRLPKPVSVNRTRRINWAEYPRVKRWIRHADALTMQAWAGGKRPMLIPGQFEAKIILPDTGDGLDLDNAPKQIIDYARRLGLIVDDSPKYMRRVIIEFGGAPEGCRLILTPL
jgi:hypothetical protein